MKIKRLVVSSFQTNCYIIYQNQQAIIIDPGDNAKKIKSFIDEQELTVLAILLTHGHCDHVGAVDKLYQVFLCPIYLHKEDHLFLSEPKYNLSAMFAEGFKIVSPVNVASDMSIGPFDIRYHHLPGHTPGSCMIEITNAGVIFSGDVLFEGSIGRFDFPLSSHHDTKLSLEYIKSMQGEWEIYPGHGEQTTLSKELLTNPYLTM